MPVPFNLIASAWRAFAWHVICPPWRFYEVRRLRSLRAYDAGHEDGRRQAERLGGHLLFSQRLKENNAGYARGVGDTIRALRAETTDGVDALLTKLSQMEATL